MITIKDIMIEKTKDILYTRKIKDKTVKKDTEGRKTRGIPEKP